MPAQRRCSSLWGGGRLQGEPASGVLCCPKGGVARSMRPPKAETTNIHPKNRPTAPRRLQSARHALCAPDLFEDSGRLQQQLSGLAPGTRSAVRLVRWWARRLSCHRSCHRTRATHAPVAGFFHVCMGWSVGSWTAPSDAGGVLVLDGIV